MAGDDETTDAECKLLARLDRGFAHQRRLDPAVLASVRAWQRTDRTYELVQNLARERPGSVDLSRMSAARHVQEHLKVAIRSWRLPFQLRGPRPYFAGWRPTSSQPTAASCSISSSLLGPRRFGSQGLGIAPCDVKGNCSWQTRRGSMYIVMLGATEWRPYTSVQLIGKLKIGGRGLPEQRVEIGRWLAANEAHPDLLASLEADRLIDSPRHSAA